MLACPAEGFAYRVFDSGAARQNEIEKRKGTTMHVTLSIIKADIGSISGLKCPSQCRTKNGA